MTWFKYRNPNDLDKVGDSEGLGEGRVRRMTWIKQGMTNDLVKVWDEKWLGQSMGLRMTWIKYGATNDLVQLEAGRRTTRWMADGGSRRDLLVSRRAGDDEERLGWCGGWWISWIMYGTMNDLDNVWDVEWLGSCMGGGASCLTGIWPTVAPNRWAIQCLGEWIGTKTTWF